MAICKFCDKDMLEADGCIEVKFNFKNELPMAPIRFYAEFEDEERCHDCNCKDGEFHHSGCDNERCPKCKGQAISCNCEWADD